MANDYAEYRRDRKRARRYDKFALIAQILGGLGSGIAGINQRKHERTLQAHEDLVEQEKLDLDRRRTAAAEKRANAYTGLVDEQAKAYREGKLPKKTEKGPSSEDLGRWREMLRLGKPKDGESALDVLLRGAGSLQPADPMEGIDPNDPTAQLRALLQQDDAKARNRAHEKALYGAQDPANAPHLQSLLQQLMFNQSQQDGMHGPPPSGEPEPQRHPFGVDAELLDQYEREIQAGRQEEPRIPGQPEEIGAGDYMQGLPQGEGATDADRSALGEFGELWKTAMNPYASEDEQLWAWSRLQQFGIQAPQWVGLRAQGLGGPVA